MQLKKAGSKSDDKSGCDFVHISIKFCVTSVWQVKDKWIRRCLNSASNSADVTCGGRLFQAPKTGKHIPATLGQGTSYPHFWVRSVRQASTWAT